MNVVVRSYVPVHVALSVRASTCAILDVKVEVVSKKKKEGKKTTKKVSHSKRAEKQKELLFCDFTYNRLFLFSFPLFIW